MPTLKSGSRHRWIIGCLLLGGLLAPPLRALLPAAAPPLPPPDPNVYAVIAVDSAQELADACWNLQSNQAIVIAAGTYDLGGVAFPNGVDGRLTVGRFGAAPITNVQIRGATGDPADVVLLGRGMLNALVPYGFQIFTATDVTIADLSLGEVYYHAVAIQNDQGATRVTLRHLRLFDAGQQIVKANRGSNPGATDVVIEWSEIFYTAGAVNHPEGSPPGSCYTNGIDAIGGQRWTIRDNLIRDITCQDGDLAGPAILMWQGSADTIVERNTLRDNARGISLGLVSSADHSGGIVRNNFLRSDPDASAAIDVAIYTTSPGSAILHNTVLTHGTYQPQGSPVAIEVRFAGATGVVVANNLLDGAVLPRQGATPTVTGNLTTAQPAWFVNEAVGDLHLVPTATTAIDQLTRHPLAGDDFDAQPRPVAAGQVDVGADERRTALFADGFESGDVGAWIASVPP